jgi:glutaredoxin 3
MLFKRKGLDYEYILLGEDPASRAEMEELSGRRSVPQIFIDNRAIGGYDELVALDRSGELDRILASV